MQLGTTNNNHNNHNNNNNNVVNVVNVAQLMSSNRSVILNPKNGMMIPVDHRGSPWSLVFGLRSSLGRLTLDAFGKVDSITYLGSTGIWLGN